MKKIVVFLHLVVATALLPAVAVSAPFFTAGDWLRLCSDISSENLSRSALCTGYALGVLEAAEQQHTLCLPQQPDRTPLVLFVVDGLKKEIAEKPHRANAAAARVILNNEKVKDLFNCN